MDSLDKALSFLQAEEDGYVITHSPSGVIHEGMELFQIMTNPSPFK